MKAGKAEIYLIRTVDALLRLRNVLESSCVDGRPFVVLYFERTTRSLPRSFRNPTAIRATSAVNVGATDFGRFTLKKIVLAISILALGAANAMAADLAPRYTKAGAAPVAAYDWTGFYVGGNVGSVWERDSGVSNFLQDGNATPQANSLDSTGVIGGIHAGYNWQMTQWVFGVEADWDWTNARNGFCRPTDDLATPCADNGRGVLTFNQKTEWLGSARARVGYAWDRFMLYGTGGAAWGKIDTSINVNCLDDGCGTSFTQLNTTGNFSNTKTGWVAGAGAEARLDANWIVRAEYLHYDLGSVTNTLNPEPGADQSVTWSRSFKYDTVRAGLSYKFGGPAAGHY